MGLQKPRKAALNAGKFSIRVIQQGAADFNRSKHQ
jgi:hypothetical protein